MEVPREHIDLVYGNRDTAASPETPATLADVRTENALKKISGFKDVAHSFSRAIHGLVLRGGKPARRVADLLHGTWLGHPLHSALTDLTAGAWMAGSLFDLLSLRSGSRRLQDTADRLVLLGTVSAVPTALAGITDYSTITDRAIRTASVHGLLNAAALVLYSLSLAGRKRGRRGQATTLSGVALGIITLSAWLGGELTYKYRISVNKSQRPKGAPEWRAVLDEADLGDRQPHRVDVDGTPVLVYRDQNQVYAIGAVCAHEGGPLDEGKFDGVCVECPWHQSVYDLRNGRVVHGPTTYTVPHYETRLRNGRLEVRLAD